MSNPSLPHVAEIARALIGTRICLPLREGRMMETFLGLDVQAHFTALLNNAGYVRSSTSTFPDYPELNLELKVLRTGNRSFRTTSPLINTATNRLTMNLLILFFGHLTKAEPGTILITGAALIPRFERLPGTISTKACTSVCLRSREVPDFILKPKPSTPPQPCTS
jgi:hypothetical protein